MQFNKCSKKSTVVSLGIILLMTMMLRLANAEDFRLPRVSAGDIVSADLLNEVFGTIEDALQRITSTNQVVGSWSCSKYAAESDNYVGDPGASSFDGAFNRSTITLNIVNDGDGTYSWNSSPEIAWISAAGRGGCAPACDRGTGSIGVRDGYLGVTMQENPCLSICSTRFFRQVFSITRRSVTGIDFVKELGTDHGVGLVCDKIDIPPSAPTDLIATASETSVALSWSDNSSNETGFKILRKDSLEGDFEVVTTTAANATSYTNTVPAAGTYWYRIKATNAYGDSFGSNEVSVTIP
ncbi:MAG: fibronectin type III domain-containing protein [Deltaproteobacteria bacterium]|nr:fibronectin type III domain-containing protein [Deltaproteobacteria bacterium]